MLEVQEKLPLVSVVMPAYNAARFIERSIRSALEQTVRDVELIVLDDGSSDDTCSIVEAIAREDDRVCLVRNERNMGVARTRNAGFDRCRGKYVALLDSDDIWYPTKLEEQIRLAEEKQADIVYCSYAMINERDERAYGDFTAPGEIGLKGLLKVNVIGCSTVLLSGDVIREHRFRTDFYHEDYALWVSLLREGKKAVGATEVLAAYRVHSGSRASNKWKSAQYRWRIYRELVKLPLWECAYYWAGYALAGLAKYRKVSPG